MFRYLLFLFVVLPLIDMLLLLQVAAHIGALETILLVIFTGIVGASMVKSEGIQVLGRLQNAAFLREAGQAFMEGALLVVGGVMLLSPGIITDLIGFALIFAETRQRLATRLRERLENSANIQVDVQPF